jgi:hypothetical protein
MSLKEIIESKNKPRGKPFQRKAKTNTNDEDMDVGGRVSSNEGGIIEEEGILNLPTLIQDKINESVQESIKNPIPGQKELDLIETLNFKNGENTLSIRFSKKHNRMFRIQIFLNDKTEIRPVTYTGASTGYGFWNLLKGSLKK